MSRKSAGDNGKASGFQQGKSSRVTSGVPATSESEAVTSDIDDLGELPHQYGTDTIFLVAQEPHWLFTYWDIDISQHPGGQTFLRVSEGDGIEAEIEVPFETRNWYIPVKIAGGKYTVEIGYNRGGAWHVLARSITIQTPPDRISESERFDYATIPLHLSFQRLIENVESAVHAGEPLMQALARLQKDGHIPFHPGILPPIPADRQQVLEALLGSDFMEQLSSGAFSSEEIEARIRERIQEKMDSQGASELLARSGWSGEVTSFFSAISALSSGGVTSWGESALSSWTAAAVTSWLAAAQSSGSAGWSGETLSSWAQSNESLSSWLQTSGAGALSSWLQAAQSSWAQAALSSWNQAALTSWSQAAVTSWGGSSETLSSFGQERGFFMHVNAEVIFYGGTDPRAKVTIDGKPITLNPDGTFRYHFIFPDGAYEIPIVATSPDGVETRSAILRFERGTQKQGKVDDTAQPPLGAPMGSGS